MSAPVVLPDPKKLAFAGDWHRNAHWAKYAIDYAAKQGADTIVQCGDFGYDFQHSFLRAVRYALEANDMKLYFVDGNHDNHGLVWNSWEKIDEGFMIPPTGNYRERLNYIPRGHRWSWWGLTFMGVGGAASVDAEYRVPNVSWWATEMITEADINKAVEGGPVDVMVTHDLFETAPWPNDRKNTGWPEEALKRSRQNRLAMQAIVDEVTPTLYVHGHYHIRRDSMARVKGKWVSIVVLDMDEQGVRNNLWFVKYEPRDGAKGALVQNAPWAAPALEGATDNAENL